MKYFRYISITFILHFLLFGCQNEETPEVLDEHENSELMDVLNGDLITPDGVLARAYTFLLNSTNFRAVQDYYYDVDGNVILTVALNPDLDTLGASIYYYDPLGRLETKKSYQYEEGGYSWTGDLKSTFEAEGTIETVHVIPSDSSPPKFRLRNVFYERGLLQVTDYVIDEERYEYSYEGIRPIRMNHMFGENIYMEYMYRYNDQGQLEAKETDIHNGGDAFQYFYDEAGILEEERENSPQWGYSILSRRMYEYY
ncbi:MAG TPA: hypothetical protein VK921_03455 [Anditalea sp.]|nr:hypothetical protein [Anditalea sp.]